MSDKKRECVRELERRLGETGTEIAVKPDYQVWWHAGAAWFMVGLFWVIRVFSFGRFDVDFNRFWTTLGGVAYAPKGTDPSLRDAWDYSVVCHELGHRYQDEAEGWSYRLKYIFSAHHRGRYEAACYALQVAAAFRFAEYVSDRFVDALVDGISGTAYLGAADEETARDFLYDIAEHVRDEEFDAWNPVESTFLQKRVDMYFG